MRKITVNEKLISAFSYMHLLIVIPLILIFVFKYKSKFVRFHTIQGFIFFIIGGLGPFLVLIPKIGIFLLAIQLPGIILFFIIVFHQVFRGKFIVYPFVEEHILRYKGKNRLILFLSKELKKSKK